MKHSLEEIVHVEQQLQHAMLKNDIPALEQLLHDDLVFTEFTGAVIGKQDDIASHVSGAIHLTELEFVEAPVTRLYGETAIVAVKAHLKGTFQGTPFASFYRYLRVWLFQDGRWQIIAGNVSVVVESDPQKA
ncbi:MAG: nuclear transport factor 2 family protein [Ktedonobacteraceae bacterium]|nr:nuclear transport factor 2 family protein [Ktedonobacteraceae bacterium]